MKSIALALMLTAFAGSAYADSPSCKTQAAGKKLAGAALSSFMKKCATDTCNAAAADKTSFVKKCVSDTLGM
ncbi:MAG: hypothetical protein WCF20_11025 [Methylovirgula sp.]